MAAPIASTFIGGPRGAWRIERCVAVIGEGLPAAGFLSVLPASQVPPSEASFLLRGTTGHVRYVEQAEKAALASVTPPLGREEASCAAFIPIRKTDAWWDLAQDERRAVLERQSQHISLGLKYLPAIARRLYHSRELGEPFDFLTWFEYAPQHASAFEELVAALRATAEWRYVEREIDLRLIRTPESAGG